MSICLLVSVVAFVLQGQATPSGRDGDCVSWDAKLFTFGSFQFAQTIIS